MKGGTHDDRGRNSRGARAAVANAFAIVLQASEVRLAPITRAGRFSLRVGLVRRPRWWRAPA
jgi:hypothetical protein